MHRSTAAESVWMLGEGVSTLAKVLIEADEQLTCGTDLDRLRRARQNLNAVAPGCLLVKMLDRQIAARVKAITWRSHDAISQEGHRRRHLHGL